MLKLIGKILITPLMFMAETVTFTMGMQAIRESWWMLLPMVPITLFVTFVCVGLSYDVWIGLD